MNYLYMLNMLMTMMIVMLSVVAVFFAQQLDGGLAVIALQSLSMMQLLVMAGLYFCGRRFENSRFKKGIPLHRNILIGGLGLCALLMLIYSLSQVQFVLPLLPAAYVAGQIGYYLIFIALAEELLFRGYAFSSHRFRPFSLLIISSLLFSVYHLNAGLHSLPYFFMLGLFFGIQRYFGATIWLLVLEHTAFNVVLNLGWKITDYSFETNVFYSVTPFVGMLIVAAMGWSFSTFQNLDASRWADQR